MEQRQAQTVQPGSLDVTLSLPAGAVGIDAGMTLTKIVRASDGGAIADARESATALQDGWDALRSLDGSAAVGVTGARVAEVSVAGAVAVQEIDAAARGAIALLDADGRLGDGVFLLALMGTGTAFAAVRDGRASHLGGTPMGGGSFAGIARRVEPSLTYAEMIAGATRGDRRKVDTMIRDVYPDGIGRIGPDLTAAHLTRAEAGSLDDFLAGLLNMHGENIAQIGASRGVVANIRRMVLAGGFVHGNDALGQSITAMAGMFGVTVEVVASPGYAGAVGAALVAAEAARA